MQKVSNSVYVETGFRGCNPSFVVTKEGVVMIDTPQMPTQAVQWRDEISKHGKVRYLINTEPHGDHFTGNYFFEGTIIAHEGVREAILAASPEQLKERLKAAPAEFALIKDYKFRVPTITLSERLTFYLGGLTFQLIHLPGHTPYEVAVYIPEEKVLFTADNVVYRVQAYLHQAVPYEWLETLKRIQKIEADMLVPGHGNVCNRSYIPEMTAFVQAWIDAIKDAIKKGMSLEEAQNKVSLLDRYPMQPGSEAMGQQVQRNNVAHMYEVLKNDKR